MSRIVTRMEDHPVAAFFVGAYAITWGIWFPLLLSYEQGLVAAGPAVTVLFYAGGFGPLASAALVTHLTGTTR